MVLCFSFRKGSNRIDNEAKGFCFTSSSRDNTAGIEIQFSEFTVQPWSRARFRRSDDLQTVMRTRSFRANLLLAMRKNSHSSISYVGIRRTSTYQVLTFGKRPGIPSPRSRFLRQFSSRKDFQDFRRFPFLLSGRANGVSDVSIEELTYSRKFTCTAVAGNRVVVTHHLTCSDHPAFSHQSSFFAGLCHFDAIFLSREKESKTSVYSSSPSSHNTTTTTIIEHQDEILHCCLPRHRRLCRRLRPYPELRTHCSFEHGHRSR